MHQIRFRPQTPLGELTALLRPLGDLRGPTSKGYKGRGEEGSRRGGACGGEDLDATQLPILVINSNLGRILYRLRDIDAYIWKILVFSTTRMFDAPTQVKWNPSAFLDETCPAKLRAAVKLLNCTILTSTVLTGPHM